MSGKRSRGLTREERQLWAFVARGVTPLKARSFPEEAQPGEALPQAAEVRNDGAHVVPPVHTPNRPAMPPLMPLERRTVTALRRGRHQVEAVIDLHGMRQSEAHDALRTFLRRSYQAGLKVVLVITGKGAAGAEHASFEERGVLRRVVPHWLRSPDLRPFILGLGEAAPQHGGSGAIYVRLRRPIRRADHR